MNKITIGAPETKWLATALKAMEFFSDLSVSDLDHVVNSVQLFSYREGATVFRQGGKPDALYVVYEGKVAVKRRRFLFFSSVIDHLAPGDFFGEMALIDGRPRSATVKTLEASKLFVLTRAAVDDIIETNPSFRKHMRLMADIRAFANSPHS